MYKYILKRLLLLVFVLFGTSLMIYCFMQLSPVDPVLAVVGEDHTPEEYEREYLNQHLDKPLLWRYFNYMNNLLHGDMGYSTRFKAPVWTLYKEKIGTTLALATSATIVATIISLPLGIIAAVKQGSLIDNTASALSVVGLAAPNFWVGLMLMILFSLKLGWFHSQGFNCWQDMVLPAITVGTGHTAHVTRTTRSSMIDVLRQDYLQLARAKGLSERKVILKHALGNALIPIVTVTGIQFSGSLGGSVLTETIFSIPGCGKLMNDALKANDITCVTGCMILHCLITGAILLLVDILYAYIDPRVKARYSN